MTAAKFKPLIFSVSGFALSNVANILIFMILDAAMAAVATLQECFPLRRGGQQRH
jgi:hypothetical protein